MLHLFMADINDLLKGVQGNVLLAPYTTFKIGGPAEYFYIAENSENIINAIKAARELKIDHCILGNGSNVLVSDEGFDGLVIKLKNNELKINDSEIDVGAGAMLAVLVKESANAGLSGLEWAAGIPGSVGGAIYGNAGAFGRAISENIEYVEALEIENMIVKKLAREDCDFSYRHSAFKEKKYIILSVALKLEKGEKEEIEKKVKENILARQKRHPTGPSAGSIFKNPDINKNQKAFEKLLKKYPEAEKFKETGKIPAGWLIEEYGILGKEIGGAIISKDHGNFILNIGGAKAMDVVMLISLIKQKIRVNFGIQLEEEIQYVGF